MQTLPGWVADDAERSFGNTGHPVEIVEAEYLDEHLKRVRFSGDLSKTDFRNGQVVEFRVSDTDFRRYTPSFYDGELGLCDVFFYLHGRGPGSDWASGLKKGDETRLMGPGGDMWFQPMATHHFFFGDESSIGLCQNLKSAVQQNDREYLCLLELDAKHCHWPGIAGLNAEVVGKSDKAPAEEAISSLNDLNGNFWEVWKPATYYLSGRARSIEAFRSMLIDTGVPARQIINHPYWSEGKKGL